MGDYDSMCSMDMLESNLKVIDNIIEYRVLYCTHKETSSGVTHKRCQVIYQIEGLY
jgi:aspartate aminotransferase-like enzyme